MAELIEVIDNEPSFIMEFTETEMRYIWHRLNLSDQSFKRAYSYAGNEHHAELYDKLSLKLGRNTTSDKGFNVWSAINDAIGGE